MNIYLTSYKRIINGNVLSFCGENILAINIKDAERQAKEKNLVVDGRLIVEVEGEKITSYEN